MKYQTILLLLFISCNSSSNDSIYKSKDYITLVNAQSFSIGGTSYSRIPTDETIAFKHTPLQSRSAIN